MTLSEALSRQPSGEPFRPLPTPYVASDDQPEVVVVRKPGRAEGVAKPGSVTVWSEYDQRYITRDRLGCGIVTAPPRPEEK